MIMAKSGKLQMTVTKAKKVLDFLKKQESRTFLLSAWNRKQVSTQSRF